jgi:multicomponent Na+:H+ antiporter subunit G
MFDGLIKEYLTIGLMLVGTLFILIAAFGILRLPDLYMRVSAATKASTLGIGLILLALAVHFSELGITSRSLATIGFIAATSPVAAHLISRSAYLNGVPLWRHGKEDELKGRYDKKTGVLSGLPDD